MVRKNHTISFQPCSIMLKSDTNHCIAVCNRLLRGEISAIETYTQAIDKFQDSPEVSLLEDMRRDHIASANRLRENVREMGGEPSGNSGAWGAWAATIEGAAKLIGDSAALKALQEGEEHGEKEYREAVADNHLMPSYRAIMQAELLPRQIRHIDMLRDLQKAQ